MTTVDDAVAARWRREYADRLVAEGHVRSPQWREAFAAVPREAFVAGHGGFTAATAEGRLRTYALHDAEQQGLLAAVYDTEATLLVQWDTAGVPTSSSSAPSVMAAMLEHLDVGPGQRVLEVGTGTGYNAALLAEALGDDAVTSIEVDPELAELARTALCAAGYAPEVLVGDGAAGAPGRGPFDGIIATCGLRRVPAALLEQLAEGGVLVAPVGLGLAVLHRRPGGGAVGRFVSPAGFQAQRSHPAAEPARTARQVLEATSGDGRRRAVVVDPEVFADESLRHLLALAYPSLRVMPVTTAGADRARSLRLVDEHTGSWARVECAETGGEAVSGGVVEVVDVALELAEWWQERGCPPVQRCGVTVHPTGVHWVWLDEPGDEARVLP